MAITRLLIKIKSLKSKQSIDFIFYMTQFVSIFRECDNIQLPFLSRKAKKSNFQTIFTPLFEVWPRNCLNFPILLFHFLLLFCKTLSRNNETNCVKKNLFFLLFIDHLIFINHRVSAFGMI